MTLDYSADYPAPRRGNFPIWWLMVGSLGAVAGFWWSERDYVAAFAIGLIAMSGLSGYYYGALRMVGGAGAIVAAYHCGPPAASWLVDQLQRHLTTPSWLTRPTSVAIASLAVILFITWLAHALSRRWAKDHDGFAPTNQLLGLGMGACQGALIILLVLSGAAVAAPLASEQLRQGDRGGQEAFARALAQRIVALADQTERSTLGPVVERYNVFDRVPQLKQMVQRVAAMQDPKVRARMANHPAIVKLQEKPAVRAAMDALANDPELREIARSGKTIDGQMALTLLDNPAVAKLLTQPELLSDIAQALSELDQADLKLLTARSAP